tara:strand:- start:2404 stop:2682 length:279 start_codon:yes stop_codon:yes gene_type:complete
VSKLNITRQDLIKNLQNKTGFSANLSKKLINDLIDVFINQIKQDNLRLKNIGNFKIIEKKGRIGRNPKSKEEFLIKERKSLRFVPSKKILNK